MKLSTSITPKELSDLLLNIALARPVFIWGPPGIGKSSLVEQFADEVGLPCVSLLGSQLAPEDLIGVPQIIDSIPAGSSGAAQVLLDTEGRNGERRIQVVVAPRAGRPGSPAQAARLQARPAAMRG